MVVKLSHQSLQDILTPDRNNEVPPHTRLLCTLGPASFEVDHLAELMRIGMKVARIDLSWGTTEWCIQAMQNVRAAEAKSGRVCAIAVDTAGPAVKVLNLPKEPVQFKKGDQVTITTDRLVSFSKLHIPIAYSGELSHSGLHKDSVITVDRYLATGDDVYSLNLVAETISSKEVVCIAQNDCDFGPSDLLHLHISQMRNEMPILSDVDMQALPQLAPHGVDFVALSVTRCEQDVQVARDFLKGQGLASTQIIAKIENKEGLVNHKAIIDACDAVIISRGSLGIDLPAEKVFVAQKLIITAANLAGKTVLATRVVDTMVHAPRPTRAEATDVANLVLDGVDGILLGLETFSGVDPANASRTVLAICKQAESCCDHVEFYGKIMDQLGGFQYANLSKSEALASSSVRATQKLNARLIIAFTITGRTPRLLSKYRANIPIVAVIAPHDKSEESMKQCQITARQSLILRGVIPIIPDSTAGGLQGRLATDGSLTDWAASVAVSRGLVKNGDRIIVSQCPRMMEGQFSEAGVVKFCVVGEKDVELKSPQKNGLMQHIGSICDIVGMEENVVV